MLQTIVIISSKVEKVEVYILCWMDIIFLIFKLEYFLIVIKKKILNFALFLEDYCIFKNYILSDALPYIGTSSR